MGESKVAILEIEYRGCDFCNRGSPSVSSLRYASSDAPTPSVEITNSAPTLCLPPHTTHDNVMNHASKITTDT